MRRYRAAEQPHTTSDLQTNMPITIHSPHSGYPVKVRDQDIGRAVRDEQGRVFYVLQREEGEGYYASKTRAGSATAETAYDKLEKHDAPAEAEAHDATGNKRSNPRGKLLIGVFVLAMLAVVLVWLFTVGPLGNVEYGRGPEGSPPDGNAAQVAPDDNAAQDDPTPSTENEVVQP